MNTPKKADRKDPPRPYLNAEEERDLVTKNW